METHIRNMHAWEWSINGRRFITQTHTQLSPVSHSLTESVSRMFMLLNVVAEHDENDKATFLSVCFFPLFSSLPRIIFFWRIETAAAFEEAEEPVRSFFRRGRQRSFRKIRQKMSVIAAAESVFCSVPSRKTDEIFLFRFIYFFQILPNWGIKIPIISLFLSFRTSSSFDINASMAFVECAYRVHLRLGGH